MMLYFWSGREERKELNMTLMAPLARSYKADIVAEEEVSAGWISPVCRTRDKA